MRYKQIGIRTLLGLVLIFAVVLGWVETRRRGLKATIASVEGLGGYVVFDTAFTEDGRRRVPVEGDFSNVYDAGNYFWFAFREAYKINFRGTDVTDSDLEFISSVSGLEIIDLYETSVTKDCLSVLFHCDTLRSIILSPSQMPDVDIERFEKLNPNCKVTVEGIEFWEMKNLMDSLLE